MNELDVLLARNADFKFLTVTFNTGYNTSQSASDKEYTYKTMLDIEVDDVLVVCVGDVYKTVTVRKVIDAMARTDNRKNINWVVCKVDTASYEADIELQNRLQKKVTKALAKKRQKELEESLLDYMDDDDMAEVSTLLQLNRKIH